MGKIRFLFWVVFLTLSAFHAKGEKVWMCTYYPEDAKNMDSTKKFIEKDDGVFDAYTDDYSGNPVPYKIIENSNNGLIAINSYSDISRLSKDQVMKLIVILLDKKTGNFLQYGYMIGSGFEDRNIGKCK